MTVAASLTDKILSPPSRREGYCLVLEMINVYF